MVATASCAVLVAADQMRDRGGEDEEREQRQQRQIGQIAGMDEAVVIDPDRDPLDDFERLAPRADRIDHVLPERRRAAASRLRLASGDWGEMSFMRGRLYAQRGARVAAAVPSLGELLERGVVRRAGRR